jgi:CRISPR-associated protein Cas2
MHTYIVCYDISSDRLRARMASVLLDAGVRIQESVYECLLSEERFAHLMTLMQAMPLAATDRVRTYRLCRRCQASGVVHGPARAPEPDYYLV